MLGHVGGGAGRPRAAETLIEQPILSPDLALGPFVLSWVRVALNGLNAVLA